MKLEKTWCLKEEEELVKFLIKNVDKFVSEKKSNFYKMAGYNFNKSPLQIKNKVATLIKKFSHYYKTKQEDWSLYNLFLILMENLANLLGFRSRILN